MVQVFAWHKDLRCPSRYVHYKKIVYATNDNNKWTEKTAKTVEEASELSKVGFEYVCQKDNLIFLRKRK